VIEYLLLNGADPDYKNKFGYTPLMLAVMYKNLEAAHTLTKNGCDINATDKYGDNAIEKAKFRGYIALQDYLK
jgi:ankyrin repeat protein